MLVLTRKKGESLIIGDNIEITVARIDDNSVKLSINAPKNITILRKELLNQISDENKNAAKVDITILNKLNK